MSHCQAPTAWVVSAQSSIIQSNKGFVNMADKISIRDLTTQLEHGDGHNTSSFFSGKFEEERFKDLEAIRKLNEQDRTTGKTAVTLNCEKDFYYSDTINITATNGAWDEFKGGKSLYSDSLDLHTLKHSDAADKVPPIRHGVNVRTLTSALESGDGKALQIALDGKYQEERANILNQVGALNKLDLAAHKTTVTLQIDVAGSKHNAGTMSVDRVRSGFHDSFFGGVPLYRETLDLETGKRDISASFDGRK